MSEEEHKSNKKIPGYSILSKLSSDVRTVKDILDGKEKKSKSLDFGSLVDIKLLTPEEFDNTFYTLTSLPSDSFKSLADEYIRLRDIYYEEGGSEELFDKNSFILTARKNIGYNSNLKDTTVIEQFMKNCNDYILEMDSVGGNKKILITQEDITTCDRIIDLLKNNRFTSKYFTESGGIEIINQLIIEFKDKEGRDIKSKLDKIYIDHNNKTITPIDVKTFGDSFISNYYTYRYYYQASIYSFAVMYWMLNIRRDLEDYTLLPFEFVTIHSSGYYPPLIYKIPELHMEIATYGGILNNRNIKGWLQLLDDFYWHIENDLWEYSREVYDKGYKLIE